MNHHKPARMISVSRPLNSNRGTCDATTSMEQNPDQLEPRSPESTFYYFAYGSCMCPVDLKRSLGEKTYLFVIGPATLRGYRLGFYHHLLHRNCGALDIVPDPAASVEGVLYQLPWRLSDRLDEREEVCRGGYQHDSVQVCCGGQQYQGVRTYTVVHKLPEELAPNDWYFNVVLRGALTCGLPEQYCWELFNHMYRLQGSWDQSLHGT